MEIDAALIKYVYLDVVGFTYKRSVEAQTDIISALNNIVKKSVALKAPNCDIVYIPVGDGICISIIASTRVLDIHIRIAEEIIRRIVSLYNQRVQQTRKFEVRIGINENVDNIITDINGNRNVCGAGVNYAQRIMSYADANQILVGRTTYENLRHREKYANSFRSYLVRAKHNIQLELFQYVGRGVSALNREPPSAFAITEPKLSKYAAYYLAHAIKNRQFIDDNLKGGWEIYSLGSLISYLAEDSVGKSNSTRTNPYVNHMPETPNNTLEEQYDVFDKLPYWINVELYEHRVGEFLIHNYSYCFELDGQGLFINDKGEQKLKLEWPEIWQEINPQNSSADNSHGQD